MQLLFKANNIKPAFYNHLSICFLSALLLFFSVGGYTQPANDNCTNASAITIGGSGFGLGTFTSAQFDLTPATPQTGETYAPSITVAGLNKKSVWYKFSIPTHRSIRVSLLQPGSAIQAGNVGFAVYKTNTCLPGNAQISTKLSPIETFGNTFHPCVETGDYLVQVTGNNAANGPVYITVEIANPSPALYDKPADAQKFGKVSVNKITAIDYYVECQTLDNAAENCSPNGSFKDYTKSTWHTFTTPDYFDWFSVLLSENYSTAYYDDPYLIGYRLYEGDVTTTPVSSLTQMGGCDSMKTNGYYPDRKTFKCGQLKTNTAYTIQLLYHKDFMKTMRLAVAWDGTAATKGPTPVNTLPVPNKMGILKADAYQQLNNASDYLACNSRHAVNNCPRTMPANGVTGPNGIQYNLSVFFSFTLATSASLNISASINYCSPGGALLRLYKQNLTANCNDLDTVNLIDEFIYYNTKNLTCLDAGNYVLQVMGSDSSLLANNYSYGSLVNSTDAYMCLAGDLGRKVDVNIYAKKEIATNKFSLSANGKFDKINAVAGTMQPLNMGVSYIAQPDTFGCANTILPDDKLCGSDTTKAVFREFVVKDSAMLYFYKAGYNIFSKLYKGDANALAVAQNKFNFPQRLTGLTPFSNCMYWGYCGNGHNTCATPGTYTLVSFGGQNQLGFEENITVTASQPRTKHFTPATAQNMGSLWDSIALYGNYLYSDEDTFTCRDNPATIGGFAPCDFNGKPATKLIYRQFYLKQPALVSISNPYWGCNNMGSMTLFTGKATDGLAGLKPVGSPWTCFTSASENDPCKAMPAGWYTVVSYGYGPSFSDPLQGMDESYHASTVGSLNQFYIVLNQACAGPQYNRPYKASVDTATKKPYLIQWAPQPDHTTAYPVTYKRYTLNTENFNCTQDTAFIRQYMQKCHTDNVKVAFYVFETKQESFVQVDIPDGLWGMVYAFDVRSKDSARLKTEQPLQTCLNKGGQIQFCKLQPGVYTLVFFAPVSYTCNAVTPTIYIDQVAYSRFDHASKAYDFGVVKADSIWYNGRQGDVNPLNNGRAPSNDFFYCTTGAQEKDPDAAVCGTKYNPEIYAVGNNIVLHPDNETATTWSEIDRRNLWYTFTVNQPGTIRIKVENKTPGKVYQYPFAVYKSDVDGTLPFSAVVANGQVDSTLLQGLTFIKNNGFYYYCWAGSSEISFYNEPCAFKPIRYYILVETTPAFTEMLPNHQVEVSVLLDPDNAVATKFDHYSMVNDLGMINSGRKKGAIDNFTCATRDLPDPIYAYDQCQKTLWYKFSTTTTGQVRYRAYYKDQSWYDPSQIQLFTQLKPGDSTSIGLAYNSYTSFYSDASGYWAQQCINPGTYYIILPGCNALNEDVYPEVEIVPQAGDFCSAPMIASLNGPGAKVVPVTVDCHTIGTDYGEFNPELTCPAGAKTSDYKSSWYRLDVGGKDTLDITVFIDEKTNASNTEIKYRMMTGNCGAMQEQSCVQDALTRNTYKCLAPGNSYYIQVFTSLTTINYPYYSVTGDIDLNISAVKHADTCLPAANCIAVANFTPKFDCTKDQEVTFTNFSTYGSSIKYDWSFGYNNQKSTAVSPRFFYPALTEAKTYSVKLIVTNTGCGKKDSITQTIAIPARPSVNLGRDTVICKNGATISYDVTSHAGATYYWYNGSTEPKTEWTYTQSPWVEINYNGCIARDTVNIWINPIARQELQTIALCNADKVTLNSSRGYGEQFKWNTSASTSSIEVSQPGYYWADLYLNGCTIRDSFLVISTDLRPLGNDTIVCQANMPFTVNATINGASSYQWQDNTAGAAYSIKKPGLYWVDISLSGCTFRDSLLVKVDSFKTVSVKASICEGQQYKLPSGKFVSVAGAHRDTLQNIRGCDSLITVLTLSVDAVKRITDDVFICAGQTYTLPSGKIISVANTYIDTVRNIRGCDSIISRINLSVAIVRRENISAVICKGNSYMMPTGKLVSISGTHSDTLRAKAGCDSLITTVNLTVLSPVVQSSFVSICSGKTYQLPSGRVVSTEGLHRDTIRYTNGCDSLISNITIALVKPISENKKVFICEGSSYLLPSGKQVNATNIYKDTIRTVAGCDSLITTVDLTVQSVIRQNLNAIICAGQSYQLPSGRRVNETGVYNDTLRYTTGCDSLISVVTVQLFTLKTISSNVTICSGNSYTLPSGRNVNTEGLHRDTIRYSNGCDSLISNITIALVKPISENKKVFICEGSSYLLPSGRQVNATNVYKDTIRTVAGCDSLITTVNLTVQVLIRQNLNAIICAGQSYQLPSGRKVNETGIYNDTLRYTTRCDSLISVIAVQLFTVKTVSFNVTICSGKNYTLPSGKIISENGLFRDTIRYVNGCDSLVSIVTLNVTSPLQQEKTAYICLGSSYRLPSGRIVSDPAIYRDTLRTADGCDSLVSIIKLNVDTPQQQTLNAVICNGQTYQLPSGKQIFTAGIYSDTLYNNRGCDSLHFIITLQVNNVSKENKAVTICSGQSYTLPLGRVIKETGIYSDTLKTITGCDSIITTVVTVRPALTLTLDADKTICAGETTVITATATGGNDGPYTYTWEGATGNSNTITVSPLTTTKYKLTVSDGCTVPAVTDSITVNVVPLPDAAITVNSKTGCAPLNLSFNNNANNVIYKWDFGTGTASDVSAIKNPSFTYQQAGNYTVKLLLTTPEGCSSTGTENITVNAKPVAGITGPLQICAGGNAIFTGSADNSAGISWNWNFGNSNTSAVQNPESQLYNSAGDYVIRLIIKNTKGCADTAEHRLKVNVLPAPGLGGGETKICSGATTMLTAKDGVIYQWTPATDLSNAAIANPVAKPAVDTRYYVTVTNAAGCQAKDSILVRVTQPFTLTASADTFVCKGTAINLQAAGAVRYEWTGEGLNQNTGASVRATPANSMVTYTVTGYGIDNCFTQKENIIVSVIPLPTVEAGRDTALVVGSSLSLLPVYSADVTEYSWTPSSSLSCTDCPFPVAAPREETTYIISVKNSYQCEANDARKISLLCSNESIFVPNTFTPNGDGVNDIFYPRGKGIRSVRYLRIYNRWGQLIFERKNFNTNDRSAGWDGTLKGQALSADVFVYTLAMVCDNNQVVETKGNIMIVR